MAPLLCRGFLTNLATTAPLLPPRVPTYASLGEGGAGSSGPQKIYASFQAVATVAFQFGKLRVAVGCLGEARGGGRSQKTGVRKQKAEVRRQESEVSMQRPEAHRGRAIKRSRATPTRFGPLSSDGPNPFRERPWGARGTADRPRLGLWLEPKKKIVLFLRTKPPCC